MICKSGSRAAFSVGLIWPNYHGHVYPVPYTSGGLLTLPGGNMNSSQPCVSLRIVRPTPLLWFFLQLLVFCAHTHTHTSTDWLFIEM